MLPPIRILVLFVSLLAAQSALSGELPQVAREKFASGLTSPLILEPYQSGERAFLVVEQSGVISFLGEDGGEPGEVFLDLRDRMIEINNGFDERGLLGLAIHPEFDSNGRFFVYYSAPLRDEAPPKFDHTSHLSEFRVPPGANRADPDSERLLLQIDEPQFNHDGGNLLFGVDGYLYVAVGDGGAANDKGLGHEPGGNGQALHRLLGKLLRIDVDSGSPYGIPPDNPLVGREGRDEIFAWGLRNPWGLALDPRDERIILAGEVGQNRFEEIVAVRRGENHGWPRYEGYAPFDQENPSEIVKPDRPSTLEQNGFVFPILAYPHNPAFGESAGYGISVTGGRIYEGDAIPGLKGVYVFADWGTSWSGSREGLFAGLRSSTPGTPWTMKVLPGSVPPESAEAAWVVGFGSDRDGELYVLTNGSNAPVDETGAIWKIVPADDGS